MRGSLFFEGLAWQGMIPRVWGYGELGAPRESRE